VLSKLTEPQHFRQTTENYFWKPAAALITPPVIPKGCGAVISPQRGRSLAQREEGFFQKLRGEGTAAMMSLEDRKSSQL
jgi:hypothetical protein